MSVFDELRSLTQSLNFHSRRHSVLTANIANAETPGYRSLDVQFSSVLQERAEQLARMHAQHLSTQHEAADGTKIVQDPSPTTNPNGNAVSLDREMAKLTANSLRYRAAAEMVSRHIGMLRYAATDGQRR